ncbi:MAG TPA: hypothetical protein DET40_02390 [Lentisphaeria bacterium]|nr:MAG: hypothetical protein A2X45_20515 [Lentisphaerae bacterium GWF2_50_93]HCE42381.1 hypothetical protein [Lentisphaeria bacterium]
MYDFIFKSLDISEIGYSITGMKRFFKYSLCLVALLFLMGALYSSIAPLKKTVAVDQLQNYKTLPWKPEDIVAFQKNAESKDGTLKFDSYVVLDQPPKEKDAAKTAKELEKYKAKYAKKGTVPFKVMADIDLIQKKDNKKIRFLKGKSDIYVLNETDKKVTLKDRVDNAKLCPT